MNQTKKFVLILVVIVMMLGGFSGQVITLISRLIKKIFKDIYRVKLMVLCTFNFKKFLTIFVSA